MNGYEYEGINGAVGKSIAATSGWVISETPGTVGNDQESNNSTGFTGYSAGGRLGTGEWGFLGAQSIWWKSSEFSEPYGQCIILYGTHNNIHTETYLEKYHGFPVRCLKD